VLVVVMATCGVSGQLWAASGLARRGEALDG